MDKRNYCSHCGSKVSKFQSDEIDALILNEFKIDKNVYDNIKEKNKSVFNSILEKNVDTQCSTGNDTTGSNSPASFSPKIGFIFIIIIIVFYFIVIVFGENNI